MTFDQSVISDNVEFVVRDFMGRVKQSVFVTTKAGKTWEFQGNRLYNALLNGNTRPPRLPLIMGTWRTQ